MAEENKTKRSKWVRFSGEEDFFINLICQKCEKGINGENFNFLVSDKNIGIFCTDCCSDKEKEEDFDGSINKKPDEINRELIPTFLNKEKIVKFISGKNLYLNFLIMIKNYRDKLEYSNE